jgi:hydrogenase maturation protein HypF
MPTDAAAIRDSTTLGSLTTLPGSAASGPGVAHFRIEVRGVVQGVGFRPYVRNLAVGYGLRGFVRNGRAGVTAEVEGPPEAVAAFLECLPRQAPPLARIDGIDSRAVVDTPEMLETAPPLPRGFEIRASLTAAAVAPAGIEVAPDTAPCAACRADYMEIMPPPGGRRRAYAFTNCTHCGPRYTITRALPYDRERTTMAGFRQCPACQREYEDPGERRYHAQPNACPACGPQLRLGAASGGAALEQARALLARGGILAVKNVGGYQLACDARQPAPVARLRRQKHRGRKPFALLARDLEAAARVCRIDACERAALQSPARPIVLLDRIAAAGDRASGGVAAAVAPGQPRLGIMLPSSPLHDLLLEPLDPPGMPDLLVMTSGNAGGEPLVYTEAEAQMQLAACADAVLEHDRPIHMPVDDSVVYCFAGRARLIRRARGYVPAAIDLGETASNAAVVFAAGAELKGAFCCLTGRRAYLSPHLGETDRLEALQRFEQTADHYLALLGVTPVALAYDPHPGYQVSRWARRWAQRRGIAHEVPVQHHHAHIAACMAEHGLNQDLDAPVLGIAWDGTGYGSDGSIWGGEFLLADHRRFARVGRLRPVRLPGGDGAVRHPWRGALGYLIAALGGEGAAAAAHRLWPHLNPLHLDLSLQRARQAAASETGVACTSAGRLFDAVAALIGVAPETVSYEGEAAIALENACGSGSEASDAYALPDGTDAALVAELDWRPMIAAIVDDLQRGARIESIARRFHRSLTEAMVATCEAVRAAHGVQRICCGGGTFLNRRLLGGAMEQWRERGFQVFVPEQAPANDGGLALGQAVVARALLAEANSCV